jgi:hypothetical protein
MNDLMNENILIFSQITNVSSFIAYIQFESGSIFQTAFVQVSY